MLKKIIILLLCVTSVHAKLTEEEQSKLAWLDINQRRSYDLDLHVAEPNKHVEITRATTKLYCLDLLKIGDRQAYYKFVKTQKTDPLSFASFSALAQYIQKLSTDETLLLRKAVVLTAVGLSSEALSRLPDLEIKEKLDFSAAFVRAEPDHRLLYVIFPPRTNFRHMLYAEGGDNMFDTMRKMIQHKYMQQQELDLWFAYWIIDIAGYRGHIEEAGSIYLTESVCGSILHLKDSLDSMLTSPNYDVLTPYLGYRAKLLGLDGVPFNKKIALAHIASMMRIYTPEEGRKLLLSFDKLPLDQQQRLMKFFNEEIHTIPTLTHVPALFANALDLSNYDIEKVVTRILPAYIKALTFAAEGISFNDLSASTNTLYLLNNDDYALTINSKYEVVLVQK